MNPNSKVLFEKEIRQTLAKIQRISSMIADKTQQQRMEEDLTRFNNQFEELIFGNNDQDPNKAEMDMKKLMSVTKSKFYLLKVTYPKLYE